MSDTDATRQQRGIQSIEVGGELLRAMAHLGRPVALKELAQEADMPAAKIHAYMVSFTRVGLMSQDTATGHYFLGPLALQLGLISIKHANPVQAAASVMPDLTARIGHTVALSVWGNRGATIVRLEESPAAIHVNMRQGTVFSTANTASGRLFAAYQPADEAKRLLEDERQHAKSTPQPFIPNGPPARPVPSWRQFSEVLDEVRAHRLSRSEGEVLPGINAMAVPVFDLDGSIVVAISAIGPASLFDISWDGLIARELKSAAQEVARRLGAP